MGARFSLLLVRCRQENEIANLLLQDLIQAYRKKRLFQKTETNPKEGKRALVLEDKMGSIGVPELIFIFVVALIVFGPRKLPELGKSLGKGLAEFRKASNELRSTFEEGLRNIEEQRPVNRDREKQPNPSPKPQDEVKSD